MTYITLKESCLPLVRIWEYSRNTDPRTLLPAELKHFLECQGCVGALWLFQTASMMKPAESEKDPEKTSKTSTDLPAGDWSADAIGWNWQ